MRCEQQIKVVALHPRTTITVENRENTTDQNTELKQIRAK
jgi:hypothetical protein